MALDAETEVHRALTTAWVESEPVSIVLRREVETDDGAGGTKKAVQDLAAQTFRMDRSSNAGIRLVTTEAGTSVPESFRLVGPRGTDVEDGDDFEIDGRRFLVTHVHTISFERVAAEVEYRGQ